MLNLVVDSIEDAVAELKGKNVKFERYEGFGQDPQSAIRGISANHGTDMVWVKNPAGNIISVLQEA